MMSNNLFHRLEPDLERELYTRHDRYLECLCDEGLDRRYLSLRRQLKEAEIAATEEQVRWDLPLYDWNGPRYWLRKELLAVEEFRLRGRVLPPPPVVPRPPFDAIRPPTLADKRPGGDAFLVRYDAQTHLRSMHERGEVRLSPAATLKAKEHNVARQDDELQKHRYTRGEHLQVTDPRTGKEIPVHGVARFTRQSPNYYFLCVSNEFDAHLFTDFEADACLIVHDPAAFAGRLEVAARAQLPGWLFGHSNVEYYDPYEQAPNEHINTLVSKDIFFGYEKEYRFCWAPPGDGSSAGNHVHLDLGPLTDITELYVPPTRT